MPESGRILLIEDDRNAQAGLFALLLAEGYSVLTANNGQQALDLFERGIRPRLVVLDLVMPKVSGTDILRYMQEDPALRKIRTIVVTAKDAEETRALVADAVFHKPVDVKALLATVKRLSEPAADR